MTRKWKEGDVLGHLSHYEKRFIYEYQYYLRKCLLIFWHEDLRSGTQTLCWFMYWSDYQRNKLVNKLTELLTFFLELFICWKLRLASISILYIPRLISTRVLIIHLKVNEMFKLILWRKQLLSTHSIEWKVPELFYNIDLLQRSKCSKNYQKTLILYKYNFNIAKDCSTCEFLTL